MPKPNSAVQWRTANGIDHLSLDECAGATAPGFYGGAAELAKLDRNTLDVYFSFIEQLWSRAQQQQAGTTPAPERNL